MPGWTSANNSVALIIDEANAADYGLDWDAYEVAMENPLYVWRYMRFGDFEQARYYAKLATPERPWTSSIYENVVMDYITVKVQYSYYNPMRDGSDGFFNVSATITGSADITVIYHEWVPEPSTLTLLCMAGLLLLRIVRIRPCEPPSHS